MEIEDVEVVLEKVWDLHDKLSDAIHSISRAHFLNSLKSLKKSEKNPSSVDLFGNGDDGARNRNNGGFVSGKDYEKAVDAPSSAITEARSLNAIRTALENLEDRLEFLRIIQVQQRAERVAAVARLDQSRIVLALRLAEHHGTRYKVIEEAMDFVREVSDSSCFILPENPSCPDGSAKHFMQQKREIKSNLVVRILSSGLSLGGVGGAIGNAALFAISMLAFLHMHRVSCKGRLMVDPDTEKLGKACLSGTAWIRSSSSVSANDETGQLDVLAARG